MKFLATIGLEIHIELSTETKMFCRCPNEPFDARPNSRVCPICLGLPGAMPKPNREALVRTVALARAVNCQIASISKFDRKHYFYPDLPKGYQISQHDRPIGFAGWLELDGQRVRIRRIHIEEDTGKLYHPTNDRSLIDFNRSGVPLVELVTEPDFSDSKKPSLFAKEIRAIVRALKIATADLEKGEMRVEANVSLRPASAKSKKLGTKVEIKNLNSFRAVERAIDREIERQREILSRGGRVEQATFGFDAARQTTFLQRIKETEADYRYFPEPDIPPLVGLDRFPVEKIDLPSDHRAKLKDLGFSDRAISLVLTDERRRERLMGFANRSGEILKTLSSLVVNRPEILDERSDKELLELIALPAELRKRVILGKISLFQAKKDFRVGDLPIEALIAKTLSENRSVVSDYRSGKKAAINVLVGAMMNELKGRVEAKTIERRLRAAIAKLRR